MNEYFKKIVTKAYEVLFTAYFSEERAKLIMQSLDWETLLKNDWKSFLQKREENPAYSGADYVDSIWQADVYAIVEHYSNEIV